MSAKTSPITSALIECPHLFCHPGKNAEWYAESSWRWLRSVPHTAGPFSRVRYSRTRDHSQLTGRLCFGVLGDALHWMASCTSIRGRPQSILIDGITSDITSLQYGVPQGSVLGPILFTIYTSPIEEIARCHNLEIHVCANNHELYTFFKIKNSVSQLQTMYISSHHLCCQLCTIVDGSQQTIINGKGKGL